MSEADVDPEAILPALIDLDVEERAALLGRNRDPARALLICIDHAARQTMVDTEDALRATDALIEVADHLDHRVARLRGLRARARALAYALLLAFGASTIAGGMRLHAMASDPTFGERVPQRPVSRAYKSGGIPLVRFRKIQT